MTGLTAKRNKFVVKQPDYLIRKVAGRDVKLDADAFYMPRILNSTLIISKAGQVYARERKSRKTAALGRLIIKARKGQVVDHKNRDPLDNRRENLRAVSYRQNMLNRVLRNSSGFMGVSIINHKRKQGPVYCATYSLKNGRRCFYCPFTRNGLIIAAMARDKFIIENQDEAYSPLNFPIFRKEPFKTLLLKSDLYEMRDSAPDYAE